MCNDTRLCRACRSCRSDAVAIIARYFAICLRRQNIIGRAKASLGAERRKNPASSRYMFVSGQRASLSIRRRVTRSPAVDDNLLRIVFTGIDTASCQLWRAGIYASDIYKHAYIHTHIRTVKKVRESLAKRLGYIAGQDVEDGSVVFDPLFAVSQRMV